MSCSGGLGITGGFVDVGGLYDCLAGIYDNVADESILDLYSDIRREKYKTVIDPVSTENFKRVHAQDAETALENDEFLKLCQKAAKDQDFAKEMLLGSNAVRYDFTQHYKSAQPSDMSDEDLKSSAAQHVEVVEVAPTAAN